MNRTTESDPIDEIESVLTELVKAIVKSPESVKITKVVTGGMAAFGIKAAQDDFRRVIGSQGKHFKALEVFAKEWGQRHNYTVLLAIDEKDASRPPTTVKSNPLEEFNAKKAKTVKDLLKRVVSLFAQDKEGVVVTETTLGSTSIIEIKVKSADYPSVYGSRMAEFGTGTDGVVVGSLKNYFDGVGKLNGRIIKLSLVQY